MTVGPNDVRKKRYETADAYTIEELKRKYQGSAANARTELLEQCQQDLMKLPVALAFWAATDENVQVRQWYALHGRLLDYSQLELAEGVGTGAPETWERWTLKYKREFSLLMILMDDPDPLVRACLRENPPFLDWVGAEEAFHLSDHMERLALLRNPRLVPPWGEKACGLLRSLLDLEDQTLKISLDERKQLVLAYLANSDETRYFRLDSVPSLENWQTQNELVAKWGIGSAVLPGCLDVRYPFFLVDDDDEVLAQFFPQCRDRYGRWKLLHAIEERGNERSKYPKTLSVAASDPDPELREMAYQLWPFPVYSEPQTAQLSGPPNEELAKFLLSGDVAVLKGLAGNATLSTEKHEKVLAALEKLRLKDSEIDLKDIPWTSLERLRREAPLAGAELLFGREKKKPYEWHERYGQVWAMHEDVGDLDRKLNVLAEKILILDKRSTRLWKATVAILVGTVLLALKFFL
jgi:hypothetical protein